VSEVQKVAVHAREFGRKQNKKDGGSESEPEMSKKTRGPGQVIGICKVKKIKVKLSL
jgi:hypothetical protein